MRNAEYREHDDLIFRMELTHYENIDIVDIKDIGSKTVDYTFPPAVFEIADINSMLKSLLPNEVEIKITIDDIRLKSNLGTNETIKSLKKSFFYTNSGFTQSLSGELAEIEGFIQLIPSKQNAIKPLTLQGSTKII